MADTTPESPKASNVEEGQEAENHDGKEEEVTTSGNNSRRCYVGNLSWSISWQDLKDRFRDAGEVVYASVMMDQGGRSKGCGIVEFSTPEMAKKAIEQFHDTDFGGRMIFVREDRETRNNDRSGEANKATQKVEPEELARRCFIGNLAWATESEDLKAHFEGCGNIEYAEVARNMEGRSRGFGIVCFTKPEEVESAISKLNDTVLGDRQIIVRQDRDEQTVRQTRDKGKGHKGKGGYGKGKGKYGGGYDMGYGGGKYGGGKGGYY